MLREVVAIDAPRKLQELEFVIDIAGTTSGAQVDRGRAEIDVVVFEPGREVAEQRHFETRTGRQAGSLVVDIDWERGTECAHVVDVGPRDAGFGVAQQVTSGITRTPGGRCQRTIVRGEA
jgi:hypothetical protein